MRSRPSSCSRSSCSGPGARSTVRRTCAAHGEAGGRAVALFLRPAGGQHGAGGARAQRGALPGRLGGDVARLVLPGHLRGRARSACAAPGGPTWWRRTSARRSSWCSSCSWPRATGSLDFEAWRGAAALVPSASGLLPARARRLRHQGRASCRCTSGCPRRTRRRPSHVSAVMSGVMIKTGIYGLVRVLTLLGRAAGVVGLAAGRRSAPSPGVLGVLFALAQHDLKRLLAYSQRREHRHHRAGPRAGARWAIARGIAGRGGARVRRRAAARAQPRALQGPALPRRRRGAARHGHAARSTGWAACSSACRGPGAAFLDRRGRDLRPAAAQRVRQRVPDLPGGLQRCSSAGATVFAGAAGARGDRRAGPDRRAGGRLLRQGLRHRLPGRAAQRRGRGRARAGPRRCAGRW